MDETGLQLNNKPGKVVAVKGSKNVPSITARENVKLFLSSLAAVEKEFFFHPIVFSRAKIKKKPEFEDGMPPGSVVTMSQKSA